MASRILREDVLEAWYQQKDEKCTCRPNVSQDGSISISKSGTMGCDLHCGHYGIATGGKCFCEKRVF